MTQAERLHPVDDACEQIMHCIRESEARGVLQKGQVLGLKWVLENLYRAGLEDAANANADRSDA